MACLIIRGGRNDGAFLPLGKKTAVIGRGEHMPLQIRDHEVSRKHMAVRWDEKGYLVEDRRSENGTFLNDQKVEKETYLSNGDVIRIGHTEMVFTLEEPRDRENALELSKQAGERDKSTIVTKKDSKRPQG